MIALLLLGLAGYVSAASVGESCITGEWSDWSSCTSSKHCRKEPLPVFSYPMEATDAWDEGRDAMGKIMAEKERQWKAIDECLAKGTCPEHKWRPIPGSHDCTQGLAGDLECLNIHQRSYRNFDELGYVPVAGDINPRGNDIWGWVDPLNNDEYAIAGLSGGTSFVRITDPQNPVTVGFIYTATTFSTWRDIKVIGNYAYIVSEAPDHGLQVFDLTRLRGRTSIEYFEPDAVNNDFGQAHNIVANEDTNFVYVVGSRRGDYPRICAGGLQVFDVKEPLNPTFVGCFGDDGYVHDAQCVVYHGPDTRYIGREICFSFNENSLTLVDVTDKSNMRMITKTGYINVAYTHQGWVTENHELVLLDDELDENGQTPDRQFTKTYAWDVRDLQNPTLRSIFEASVRSIDHNQYILGDLTFQSNYESGLRVLHINEATYELNLVAFIDIYPIRTAAEFNGAWSVYPYFPSGNVVIQSINHGLFVVEPDMPAIRKQIQSKAIYAEQTRSRPVLSVNKGSYCPALVETKTCDAPVLC
jgi:choice-of-anchor B domain-containing protein